MQSRIPVNPQITKYVYCPDGDNLTLYLKSFGISNLESYIYFLEKEEATRAEATEAASNSKHKKGRVFNGFFLKSYLPINGKIEDQIISLQLPKGTWLYIENYKTLEVANDITIVGIENSETFTYIENYKHLFESIKPLFLLRFNNNSYIEWLQQIPNDYCILAILIYRQLQFISQNLRINLKIRIVVSLCLKILMI